MHRSISLMACILTLALSAAAQSIKTRDVVAHDPVMIKQGDTFYLFSTGRGIAVWSSADLQHWTPEKPVFDAPPPWAVEAVPTFKGHIWAPDISFFNGQYYLYYSISAFGKNTSCIGLATNKTLDPNDAAFQWVDHGKILQSYPGKTNWNAIDPNLVQDEAGVPYLAFGSFWGGLKLIRLSRDGMQVDQHQDEMVTIASRKKKEEDANAIEAPFIFKKNDYYYLFASIDYCCKGSESTYKMIVGRAKEVRGPYLDDKGEDLAKAGGKLLLQGDEHWHGVGHNAVFKDGTTDYILFHGYDAQDDGKPKLSVEKLAWNEAGWPEIRSVHK